MKITDVAVHVVRPFDESPFGPEHHPSYVFVEISTDDGITGFGEGSNWLHGSDLIVATAAREIGRSLVGADPYNIEKVWNDTFRKYTYLGNRGVITHALSGIDMALWDIKGQALGVPVHELLGGAIRDRVRLYTHPGGGMPDEVASKCVALQGLGYEAFKFDPFYEMQARHSNYVDGYISRRGIREATEIVRAVREATGPDAEIMIDFHGQYNVEAAVRCIDALQPFGITWFEEPLPPESVAGLAQVRSRTDAPLCVGERLHTRFDFAPILSAGLADFIMPDVCWTGGISELRKIATLAESYFVPVAPHGAVGPLQAIAGAHVMMVTPNFYRLEVLGPDILELYNEALTAPLDVRDGELGVSGSPGLGVALNLDYARRRAHPDWSPR